MSQLRYLTAGESHGEALVGILDGMPAGLPVSSEQDIDPALADRQRGYGRSHRQKIEQDKAQILSGVRFGMTTGGPIAIMIRNKDWENWKEEMSVADVSRASSKPITTPRPGHADLAGGVKYGHTNDLRNVFERASARETAMRVALGAIAKKLLKMLSIDTVSYVRSIGNVDAGEPKLHDLDMFRNAVENSDCRTFNKETEQQMKEAIDKAKKEGDTLGGIVEAIAFNMPVGVGSSMQWDRKLDARLAESLMSVQAVKSVEIGDGLRLTTSSGSQSHDPIIIRDTKLDRSSNHSGGLEGGMTTGAPIIVRAGMKPISTLMQPLPSVDLATGQPTVAHIERSDVCAVPSLSVIVEHIMALVLADALIDTFAGDTINELQDGVTARRKAFEALLAK